MCRKAVLDLRIQLERAFQGGNRRLSISSIPQRESQIQPQLCFARLKLESLLVKPDCDFIIA